MCKRFFLILFLFFILSNLLLLEYQKKLLNALGDYIVKKVNLVKVRKDILWVSNSLLPSVHFYVCRHYPALRLTRQIFYGNKPLESFSLGIHIEDLRKFFEKLHPTTKVSVYLNDEL